MRHQSWKISGLLGCPPVPAPRMLRAGVAVNVVLVRSRLSGSSTNGDTTSPLLLVVAEKQVVELEPTIFTSGSRREAMPESVVAVGAGRGGGEGDAF